MKYKINNNCSNKFCIMIFNKVEDETKSLKYIDENKLFNENEHYNYYSN